MQHEILSQEEIQSLLQTVESMSEQDTILSMQKHKKEQELIIIPDLKNIAYSLYMWYYKNKEKDSFLINYNIKNIEDINMEQIETHLNQINSEDDWKIRGDDHFCSIVRSGDHIQLVYFNCFIRKYKEIIINLKEFYLYVQPILNCIFNENEKSNALLRSMKEYLHRGNSTSFNLFTSTVIKVNKFKRSDSLWYY